jgi:hypothetical protein
MMSDDQVQGLIRILTIGLTTDVRIIAEVTRRLGEIQ